MNPASIHQSSRSNSRALWRRYGLAGAAAILTCAACCALPLLFPVTAAVLGTGAVAALAHILRPGTELAAGAAAFAAALGLMALRRRARRRPSCDVACDADRSGPPARSR